MITNKPRVGATLCRTPTPLPETCSNRSTSSIQLVAGAEHGTSLPERVEQGRGCDILALDPGDTTGWCAVLDFPPPAFEAGEAPMEQVVACILQHTPAEVVVEGWRVYPWAAKGLSWNKLEPVQLIGAIKWFCLERGIPCVEQAASVKAVISRTMLQTFDLWKLTRGKPHARDAARHALYRLWMTRQDEFLQHLKRKGANA